MDKYLYFSTIPIAIFLMVYLKPRIILLLYTKGLRTSNYHGREVVYGAGLVFLIPCIISVLPLWDQVGKDNLMIYLAVLLSMTLMGYLDDSLGDSSRKGFKNHINGLLSGYVSHRDNQNSIGSNNWVHNIKNLFYKDIGYSFSYHIILSMR